MWVRVDKARLGSVLPECAGRRAGAGSVGLHIGAPLPGGTGTGRARIVTNPLTASMRPFYLPSLGVASRCSQPPTWGPATGIGGAIFFSDGVRSTGPSDNDERRTARDESPGLADERSTRAHAGARRMFSRYHNDAQKGRPCRAAFAPGISRFRAASWAGRASTPMNERDESMSRVRLLHSDTRSARPAHGRATGQDRAGWEGTVP